MSLRSLIYRLVAPALILMGCSSPGPKNAPLPDTEINDPTRLIEQAARGNEAVVKTLLVNGEKVDQANSQGVTALMVASRKGHLGVIQMLLAARANPAVVDEQGSTALHYAILGNQTKAAELLLQVHAPVDAKDGFDLTPLMLATRFADLPLLKILLKAKANVALADENGWSAIFFAIPRGDPEIFDAIADELGEFHMLDAEGDGLVATAVQYKQHILLKKLIDAHAPFEAPNKKGVTPLQIAIENGDAAAVRMLTKLVSPNIKFVDGRTPLMVAIDLKQKEVAGLLFSLKADHSAKDRSGRTYLDHLSAYGLDSEWLGVRTP